MIHLQILLRFKIAHQFIMTSTKLVSVQQYS